MTVQRRVEWHDTDASGFYHNTVAFRLFEAAETMLLERLGILDDVYGRLPRVHMSCDFMRLLGFHDVVSVNVSVAGVGASSITYGFDVVKDGQSCARGKTVAVLLDRAGGTKSEWSDDHRRLLLTSGEQAPEMLTK